MAFRVSITSPAERDAYAAFDYIQSLAPDRAEPWFKDLFSAVFSLAEMPTRCPIIPEATEIGLPIRHLLFSKYPSVYRIIFDLQNDDDKTQYVRVLRIWHGARITLTLDHLYLSEDS